MLKEKKRKIHSLFIVLFLLFLAVGSGRKTVDEERYDFIQQETRLDKYLDKLGTGQEVTVAVIDTGINVSDNQELQDRITDPFSCMEDGSITDAYGHGTKMAMLIAANTPESVKLMPVKVADGDGCTTVKTVCEGIQTAAEQGADIINLSLNTDFYSDGTELEDMIARVTEQGIPVIVSAGNKGVDAKNNTPSNSKNAIVVGAVNEAGDKYYFSNHGENVDYYAYGTFQGENGTSFAAGYVTSIVSRLMAGGVGNVEGTLRMFADELGGSVHDGWHEKSYLGSGSFVYGEDQTAEEEERYIAVSRTAERNLKEEICSIAWEDMGQEELDAYLSETDDAYVGMFLSSLSGTELDRLKEQSQIVNTNVSIIAFEYSEEDNTFYAGDEEEINFIEHRIQSYEEMKGVMSVSGDGWLSKSGDGVFYISSPDRKKIYKYTVSGWYNKYLGINEGLHDYDLKLEIETYKNEWSSNEFTRPIPTTLYLYLREVHAHEVHYRDNYGNLLMTSKNYGLIDVNLDNGKVLLGMGMKFRNYNNTRTGYHTEESGIEAYNAEAGVGTSTEVAKSYTCEVIEGDQVVYYPVESLPSQNISPEIKNSNFNKTISGNAEAYFRGEYKEGYNASNPAYWDRVYLESELRVTHDDIHTTTNETSFNGSQNFMMNFAPFSSMGLDWYASNGKLASTSDIPEYVMNLVPNRYTITYNGNGATGGSTGASSHTYDTWGNLSWNGYAKSGHEFTGWNTSADGSGTSYANGQNVLNITSQHNENITLYAQWKPAAVQVTLDANGGTLYDYIHTNTNTGTTSFYAEIGKSYYDNISRTAPVKEGHIFQGWYTDGGTKVWDENGEAVNDTGFWSGGLWTYGSNVTVYARWKAGTYQTGWNPDGGTVPGQGSGNGSYHSGGGTGTLYLSYQYGTRYGTLPVPARTGYRFGGWQHHTGSTWQYGVSPDWTQPASCPVWKAGWNVNSYAVRFDGNSATGGSTGTMNCVYDQSYHLNQNGFYRTGYTFTGWNRMQDGSGESFSDGQQIRNLTAEHNGVVTLYAQWEANAYTIAFHPNDGGVVTYLANIDTRYDVEVTLPDGADFYQKYTLDGVNVTGAVLSGSLSLTSPEEEAEMPEGETEGSTDGTEGEEPADTKGVESVPDDTEGIKADDPEQEETDDETNAEDRPDPEAAALIQEEPAPKVYPSVFMGWSVEAGRNSFIPQWKAGDAVQNLTAENNATVTLYAVWDDCPWIQAEDLYYSLEQAQSGYITELEILSHATASDREDGSPIAPGFHGNGTSFSIPDYLPEDFTLFQHEGSVTENLTVVDSVGSRYKKQITVHIVDTTPTVVKPEGTTRFISEKYYHLPYEEGGLEDDSIWKTDPEYRAVLEDTFRRLREDDPEEVYEFSHEDILEMKKFVEENGIGNSKRTDALSDFYKKFLVPNRIK